MIPSYILSQDSDSVTITLGFMVTNPLGHVSDSTKILLVSNKDLSSDTPLDFNPQILTLNINIQNNVIVDKCYVCNNTINKAR